MLVIHFILFPLPCGEDREFNANFSQVKIMRGKKRQKTTKTKQNIHSFREFLIQYRCLLGIGSPSALLEQSDICSKHTGTQVLKISQSLYRYRPKKEI